ncbi:CCA tRNA nucleotidyltransferase [Paenibacillus puldeungensis]|uniref:CCA tRNA nucleotidyltransferase n=1 Tax=Paenibacillus puldeungensis TaxID=696536 RepID=A0ABW3S2Q0_9BACL
MNHWRQVDPLMQDQGEKVLQTLLEHGFQAFFVGGCVRDELMARPVHDMDIATSAKPDDVIGLFEHTVPTGIQHGTVTVLMGGVAFEVTTFRKESQYADHRRPTSVEFVDAVTEDLQRRDFTMNAIARDIDGHLTDPFCGQADIERGVIRCVGVAEERFEEDALRMVRAIRFASVFGFRPVKSLWKALMHGKNKLSYIAIERIRIELEKTILGPKPLRGLALLERSGLLKHAKVSLPQYENSEGFLHAQKVLLSALDQLPATPEALRWSLLFQTLGVPGDEVASYMKSWTFPNATAQETAAIVRFDEAWSRAKSEMDAVGKSDNGEELLRREWIKLEILFGKSVAALWLTRQGLSISKLDCNEGRQKEQNLLRRAQIWHDEVRVHTLSELAVNGGEVQQMKGRKGGPWLGELMKELLLATAYGDVQNEKQALLDRANTVVKETWDQAD